MLVDFYSHHDTIITSSGLQEVLPPVPAKRSHRWADSSIHSHLTGVGLSATSHGFMWSFSIHKPSINHPAIGDVHGFPHGTPRCGSDLSIPRQELKLVSTGVCEQLKIGRANGLGFSISLSHGAFLSHGGSLFIIFYNPYLIVLDCPLLYKPWNAQ